MADPGAALRETRRVPRPGGRVARSVWDRPDLNPWATMTLIELVERGVIAPPDPGAPGMFALADPGKLFALLNRAGFSEIEIEIEIEAVPVEQWHENFDALGRPSSTRPLHSPLRCQHSTEPSSPLSGPPSSGATNRSRRRTGR